jgi:hypothetical protein
VQLKIAIRLNPKAKNAAIIRAQLQAELSELSPKSLTQSTEEVPGGELSVHEVVQFVIEHADHSLTFATAIFTLVKAIIDRQGSRGDSAQQEEKGNKSKGATSEEPPMIEVQIGESVLRFPANDNQIKRYISKVLSDPEQGKTKQRKSESVEKQAARRRRPAAKKK